MASFTPPASWLSPCLTVTDVDKAASFYKDAFGFDIKELSKGDDQTTWHAQLLYKGQLVMLSKEGAYGFTTPSPSTSEIEPPVYFYLYCEDVDSFYQDAVRKGTHSLQAPEDMFWGDRMCRLSDPESYIWCFATPKGQ